MDNCNRGSRSDSCLYCHRYWNLGNLMVVLVTITENRIRTKGRAFIASLAIADTLASTNLIFMPESAVNYGKWVFSDTFCQLNGFLTSQFVASLTYSLRAISVNRYLVVVKQNPAVSRSFYREKSVANDYTDLVHPYSSCHWTCSWVVTF